jgi:Cys-rich repeat protein
MRHCRASDSTCVQCASDADCDLGKICLVGSCGDGCSRTHGCPLDGGVCEADAGYCVECNVDADCRDPKRAFCDGVTNHRCYECNPRNDTCLAPNLCVADNGGYACQFRCKTDYDCTYAPLTPHCSSASHECVACLQDSDCPLGRICKGNKCV